MRMRIAPLLVLALLAAGCAGPAAQRAQDGASAPGAWTLDCTLGAHGVNASGWAQRCLAKVSDSPRTKAETWIAVSPKDPAIIVAGVKDMDPAKSNACVWVSYYATTDGGATWRDITPDGKYADRKPTDDAFGWACNTDPMMAFTSDGMLHVIVEKYALGKSVNTLLSAGTRFDLYTSPDAGRTWPVRALLVAGDGLAFGPDYTRMVASPKTGTLVTSFIDFTGGERCYVVAARDGGKTVDKPIAIPTPGSIGCQVAAVSDEGVFTVGGIYGAAPATPGTTYFAISTDDAQSFSAPLAGFAFSPAQSTFPGHQAYTGTGLELRAALAGPHKGALYATSNEMQEGQLVAKLRKSLDHGKTWSAPLRIGDATGVGLVDLAVADDGSLHAFYLREGPDKLVFVEHAWSLDDGLTWRAERVSDKAYDPDTGRHQDGGVWFGDYVGVTSEGRDVWAAFPDSSLGGEPVLAVAHAHRA